MALEQHIVKALVALVAPAQIHAQRRRRAGRIRPRLDGLERAVGMADDAVGLHVHFAVGRHLIAHAALRAVHRHGERFIFERVGILIAAKLAPAGMEFARHAQILLGIAAHEAGARRHFVIAAPCGGQILHLEMRLAVQIFRTIDLRAAVEEDRGLGVLFAQYAPALSHEMQMRAAVVFLRVALVVRIHARRLHAGQAVRAVAGPVEEHDVVEQAVQIGVAVAHLARNVIDMLCVIAAQAQMIPCAGGARIVGAGVRIGAVVALHAVFIAHAPFGMPFRIQHRPARRDIDGRGHTDFMRGLDHRAGEIEAGLHRGVLRAHARGIVAIAVMALGEHSDRVDVSFLQRGLKLRLVKPAPHAGNMRRRMKIQMHLSCGQLSH